MPPVGAPGAPAAAVAGGSGSSAEPNPWYDIFVKPFNPWYDRTRYEMWRFVQDHTWGIPAALVGSTMTYFSQQWMRMVPGAQLYAKVLGPDGVVRTLPRGYMHAHAVPDEVLRGRWASRSTWLKRAGGVVAGAGGVADQWVRDSRNPNLATDERVGRATMNGVTIGAATFMARYRGLASAHLPVRSSRFPAARSSEVRWARWSAG